MRVDVISNERIPKIIHYCWFGKKEKPELIKKCIKSWKNILYDYKIIEWNENNFDLTVNKFVEEAYKMQKYAFVSDYVRLYALYNFGGVYLDTDVEVLKSFNDILENESFWGFEEGERIATSTIGAKKKCVIIKEFLDYYNNQTFIFKDGSLNTITNVSIITSILSGYGIVMNGKYQQTSLVTIYPKRYFSPYDYINCYNAAKAIVIVFIIFTRVGCLLAIKLNLL